MEGKLNAQLTEVAGFKILVASSEIFISQECVNCLSDSPCSISIQASLRDQLTWSSCRAGLQPSCFLRSVAGGGVQVCREVELVESRRATVGEKPVSSRSPGALTH